MTEPPIRNAETYGIGDEAQIFTIRTGDGDVN